MTKWGRFTVHLVGLDPDGVPLSKSVCGWTWAAYSTVRAEVTCKVCLRKQAYKARFDPSLRGRRR